MAIAGAVVVASFSGVGIVAVAAATVAWSSSMLISSVFIAVGAALVGIGATWLWLSHSRQSASGHRHPSGGVVFETSELLPFTIL